MWRQLIFLVVVVLVAGELGGASAVAASTARMPLGSFITRPVSSPADLADLIMTDQVTASRLAKHFKMEPRALADYFRRNVRPAVLSTNGVYSTFYLSSSGRIVPHTKRLKVGTLVFVDYRGTPLMEVRCGNPLVRVLPYPPEPVSSITMQAQVTPVGAALSSQPAGILAVTPVMPAVAPTVLVLPAVAELVAAVPNLMGATMVYESKAVPEPGSCLTLLAVMAPLLAGKRRCR